MTTGRRRDRLHNLESVLYISSAIFGFPQMLENFLEALFETEICEMNYNPEQNLSITEPFLSKTTLHAFRITLNSAIQLTEELLGKGYKFILTAKWNQDSVEVRLNKI